MYDDDAGPGAQSDRSGHAKIELTYRAHRPGFEVRLTTADSGVLTATASGPDAPLRVDGSLELQANFALVALVEKYALNESAYRRLRSPEKRESHRKAAAGARKDAMAVAAMVLRLGTAQSHGWCSGCFERTTHLHVTGHERPKRTYLCGQCGTPTTACAVPGCGHFAALKPTAKMTIGYCAEHRHEIPSFESLTRRLGTFEDVSGWLAFKSRNAKRITRVAGGTIAFAAVVAPAAFFAAPVVGAALGGSALGGGLSGAAATSHGLAMLGFGSLATGGLGMAGGTAVVTATGTALGGILGGVTAAAYAGSDKSFRIELLRAGVGTPVLLASGFLTDKQDEAWGSWQPIIDARFPNEPVYRVHWGAKELGDIGSLLTSASAKTAVRRVLTEMAKRGSTSFGRLPGLGLVFAANDILANPWTVAKNRAAMTGAVLADLIARTDEGPVVLVGHSLGARVMVTAAQALGTIPGSPRVEAMHLLGAAVGVNGDWRTLNDAVSGTVWNYHSRDDAVLKRLYTVAELGQRAVGRSGFGSKFVRIKDRDVTRTVPNHSAYFANVSLV